MTAVNLRGGATRTEQAESCGGLASKTPRGALSKRQFLFEHGCSVSAPLPRSLGEVLTLRRSAERGASKGRSLITRTDKAARRFRAPSMPHLSSCHVSTRIDWSLTINPFIAVVLIEGGGMDVGG